MSDRRSRPGDGWLVGGGEMGRHVRGKDWSRTPLGPLPSWPQSLRTTVGLALSSNFPIALAWGPRRVQIYNDGYWPICGAKHPHSMGQDFKECWFSAWDAIGEAFERATAGETAFLTNQRMFLDRNGYLEETFFTFSFSPIRDESGGVGGLFHPVTELTQQSLTERRLKVLRDVSDHAADAKSVEEACRRVTEMLQRHPFDVPFALLYRLDGDPGRATLAGSTGFANPADAGPAVVELDASPRPGWPLAQAAHERSMMEVGDLAGRIGPLACGPYPESPHTAFILPVHMSGLERPLALLVAGVSSRRALDEAYRNFYALLGDAVTNALTNARAYQEERKRAEALAELDRAKTAFFSNVSHEFRTPLTLMLGPLEDTLANAHGTLPAAAAAELTIAHRNSLRLLKLVNTLLDFSRIEAGRIDVSYEAADLPALTSELASVFRSAIERAGLRYAVDCPPMPPGEPAWVDRQMWEKIVLNLLSNAFKFTFDGEIDVRLEASATHAQLSVRDTGVGIPPAELSRVFERFHRVKDSRGRTHEGTGIGLALVQELVRLHGGTVHVESDVGRGSRFVVSIPRGRAHLPAEALAAPRTLASTAVRGSAWVEEALRWLPSDPAQARPVPAAAIEPRDERRAEADGDGPRPRILWADDNADMREYVGRLLGGRYDVQAVRDGTAALESARANPPELVLSDIMMPGLDGFGLLREMRSDPRLRDIPVVLLSARAGEEARIEGMNAGADDYLTKPFSARELLARVEAHVNMAQLRRETREAIELRSLQFETLLNRAPIGVYLVDADLRIRAVNPVAAPVFGDADSPEGVLGMDLGAVMRRLWTKEFADEIVGIFRHTLETGEPYVSGERAEYRVDRRVVEHYEGRVDRITLPDGRYGLVCYFRDISSQVQAREALQRSVKRVELLAETASLLLRSPTPQAVVEQLCRKVMAVLDCDVCFNYLLDPEAGKLRLNAWVGVPDDEARRIEWLELGEAVCGRVAVAGTRIVAECVADRRDPAVSLVRSYGVRAYACHPLLNQGVVIGTLSFGTRGRASFSADDLSLMEAVTDQVAIAMQRKRTEEALRESEATFRAMFSISSVGKVQADLRSGRFLRVNEAMCRITGYTEAELLASGFADITHPEDRERDRAAVRRLLAGETSSHDEEKRYVRKDGSVVWARTTANVIRDEHGRPPRITAVIQDITERRQAEDALRESEERFRLLADHMSQFAWMADGKGWVFWYNRRWYDYTGTTLEQMQGWGWKAVHHPDHVDRVVASVQRSWDTGKPWEETFPLRGKDGAYRWFLSRALPIRDEQGQVVRWFGTNTDVTEQRALEEALREQDRRKDEFLATLAHELRNPLAPVRNSLELMKRMGGNAGLVEQSRSTMERQIGQMVRLIDDLLDVSRITRNKLVLRRERVELAHVVQQAVEACRPQIEKAGHAFDVHVPPQPVFLDADPVRLAQVFGNLLTNACRYTEPGGWISLTARVDGGEAEVAVKDGGIGIPPEMLPRVFDLFTQLDRSLERSQGGLGIGLSLVKRLVEMHDGTVSAHSAGAGRGSEFVVRLPVPAGLQPALEEAGEADEAAAAPSARRILVVDDNRDSADSLATLLQMAGNEIRIAYDGEAGMEAAAAFQPDVVLLDLGMPKMNGYETCRRIREQPWGSAMTVLALSGWGQDEDRRRSSSAGFDGHLVKPVDYEQLMALLAEPPVNGRRVVEQGRA